MRDKNVGLPEEWEGINFFEELSSLIKEIERILESDNYGDMIEGLFGKLRKELLAVLSNMFLIWDNLHKVHFEMIENFLEKFDSPNFDKTIEGIVVTALLDYLRNSKKPIDPGILDKAFNDLVKILKEEIIIILTKIRFFEGLFKLKWLLRSICETSWLNCGDKKAETEQSSSKIDDSLMIELLNDTEALILNLVDLVSKPYVADWLDEDLFKKWYNWLDERVFKKWYKIMNEIVEALSNNGNLKWDDVEDKGSFYIQKLNDLKSLVGGVWLILRWQGELYQQPFNSSSMFNDMISLHRQELYKVLSSEIFKEYIRVDGDILSLVVDLCESELSKDCVQYLLTAYNLQQILNGILNKKFTNNSNLEEWKIWFGLVGVSEEEMSSFKNWLKALDIEDVELKLKKEIIFDLLDGLYQIIISLNDTTGDSEAKKLKVLWVVRNIVAKLWKDPNLYLSGLWNKERLALELSRLKREKARLEREYNSLKSSGRKTSVGRQKGVWTDLSNLAARIKEIEKQISRIEEQLDRLKASESEKR